MPAKASTSAAAAGAAGSSASTSAAPSKSAKSATASGSTKSASAGVSSKRASTSGTSGTKASASSKPSSSAGPAASDHGSSSAAAARRPKPDVKLNSVEASIHRYILSLPEKTLIQSEVLKMVNSVNAPDLNAVMENINSMMRKSLLKVVTTARGERAWVAASIAEAREMSAMDPHEKLVLDHIKVGGNAGVWVRKLKTNTGLHQNVLNRAIKALEQKKLIKQVKSVKHTTRKIYMQADLVPSIDVTGGPWYSKDGQLDKAFIDSLIAVAKRFIRSKSLPDPRGDKMWPRSHIPYLPTANDVLEYLTINNVLQDVELDIEHIEVILNVCVYDGDIERIWCIRHSEDGKDWLPDPPEPVALPAVNGKKRKKEKSTKARKRARRDSADIDKDSDDDDSEDDEEESEEEEAKSEPDDDYQLPPPLKNGSHHYDLSYMHDDSDKPHKRPGPSGNSAYWVYRTVLTGIPNGTIKGAQSEEVQVTYPDTFELGITQTPCGICPVAQFCHNRGAPKVLPLPGEKDLDDAGTTGLEEWRTSTSVSARAKAVGSKNPSKQEDRIKALLKMKAPSGGGELEDADGKWKGGGKVGGKVIAPVNPTNCRYYAQWFGEEFDW